MSSAAAANAIGDASGIDPSLLRVLCVRCAKLLSDSTKVENGHRCKSDLIRSVSGPNPVQVGLVVLPALNVIIVRLKRALVTW